MDSVRIDKYLWAIRVFKTRSEAADACNGGKVKLNGTNAKASKTVKPGDLIDARKGPVVYNFRILKLSESRMGAALVPDYAENLTPEAELDKLHSPVETVFLKRDKGAGRPTKKDRRTLDALMEDLEG